MRRDFDTSDIVLIFLPPPPAPARVRARVCLCARPALLRMLLIGGGGGSSGGHRALPGRRHFSLRPGRDVRSEDGTSGGGGGAGGADGAGPTMTRWPLRF